MGRFQLLPQFNAGHATKMNVEKKTIGLTRNPAGEKLFRRREDSGPEALRVQQVRCGPQHAGVVVYYCHKLLQLPHRNDLSDPLGNNKARNVAKFRPIVTELLPEETCL